jgi:hypothetical protein
LRARPYSPDGPKPEKEPGRRTRWTKPDLLRLPSETKQKQPGHLPARTRQLATKGSAKERSAWCCAKAKSRTRCGWVLLDSKHLKFKFKTFRSRCPEPGRSFESSKSEKRTRRGTQQKTGMMCFAPLLPARDRCLEWHHGFVELTRWNPCDPRVTCMVNSEVRDRRIVPFEHPTAI